MSNKRSWISQKPNTLLGSPLPLRSLQKGVLKRSAPLLESFVDVWSVFFVTCVLTTYGVSLPPYPLLLFLQLGM